MCRKLSVRCRKWRARESLLFLPGFSPLQTITYWNLGMHLMYIQQSFVFFFKLSSSCFSWCVANSPFPFFAYFLYLLLFLEVGSSKKPSPLPFKYLDSFFENLGCPNKQFLFSNLLSFFFHRPK